MLFLGLLFGHLLGALLSISESVVTAIDKGAKAMELGVKLFPIVEFYSYIDYRKCLDNDRNKAEFSGIKAYMFLIGVFMFFYFVSNFNIFFLSAAGINYIKVLADCIYVVLVACSDVIHKILR